MERECKTACVIIRSNGEQRRTCGIDLDLVLIFAGLAEHDKKCTTVSQWNSIEYCVCNYDLCNENLANSTSLASLTLLASLMLALTI